MEVVNVMNNSRSLVTCRLHFFWIWHQLASFNYFSQPLRTEAVVSEAEPEESLGPIEPPYPSPRYKRNYTVFLTQVCYLILSHNEITVQ
jgi:hypothetical protein